MKNIYYYETRLGRIRIAEEEGQIIELVFGDDSFPGEAHIEETEILKEANLQLQEYLDGKRKNFDLPLHPKGTEFQKRNWAALSRIPYGETRTYGQIAEEIGCPRGARAVGLANNKNPISIIIPCHRVIGANGKLVGYGGGLDKKIALLELEGIQVRK